MAAIIGTTYKCYHCGEECKDQNLYHNDKHFCCEGCKLVFGILDQNGLCEYYDLSRNPGITQKIKVREGKFSYLDDRQVINKLVHFTDNEQSRVTFYLPQIHCSSCIWLLENLHKLDAGIIQSRVNFQRKEITIIFHVDRFSLRKVAEQLTQIGYEPHISLNDIEDKKITTYDRSRIFKLGLAGFCFGNIMMLSFPEYFSYGNYTDKGMKEFFGYLNLFLSLPVFFYSASEFYISAWKSLKQKFLNIDAPIALAVIITFARSIYEIISGTGAGYLDSMSGIVFFMLIGRFFQDKSYQSLSFERDYKSYFPISVTVKKNGIEENIPVSQLKVGNRIVIHNNELIPADSILFYGKAAIDYSFVTGESVPIEKTLGEIVYAGGKQLGGTLEMEVVKEVSQSYLTQLWNDETFDRSSEKKISFIHELSRKFTWILFAIAASAGLYWYVNEPSKILNAITSVLIVACPCALLLSATFTNGNMLRIFGNHKFYIKNASVIESIADADTIVFDKTGTITQNNNALVTWEGSELSSSQKDQIFALVRQSTHPSSLAISYHLSSGVQLPVSHFKHFIGEGMEGIVEGKHIRIGSPSFVTGIKEHAPVAGKVYVRIDDKLTGHFIIQNEYRKGFEELIKQLSERYRLALVSGDNSAEQKRLIQLLGTESTILFDQSPENKLQFIEQLQKNGHKVVMIGDGLNDAGALKKSDAGIVVSDNINNFSPACDAILDGTMFSRLGSFFEYAKAGKKIIIGSFIISIIYNIIGLTFAVQGTLSPVIAAILMPISSISIVAFTTGVSTLVAKKIMI
ncbi:MAG: heavy metal translocating P-type ATPase metal-binding domain-containing protein [Bacteroidetes bacterium]|nr:heavy metal translocating P-type ATPase metal-binding domain-containing protein [Bacteroidota bacterium]